MDTPQATSPRDDVLDNITFYWLTSTAVSSARLYWENKPSLYNDADVSVPAAVSVFPGENYQAPRSWTERAYHNLIYFNEVDKGWHFAAWEQPQLFQKRFARASGHCANSRVKGAFPDRTRAIPLHRTGRIRPRATWARSQGLVRITAATHAHSLTGRLHQHSRWSQRSSTTDL